MPKLIPDKSRFIIKGERPWGRASETLDCDNLIFALMDLANGMKPAIEPKVKKQMSPALLVNRKAAFEAHRKNMQKAAKASVKKRYTAQQLKWKKMDIEAALALTKQRQATKIRQK